MLSKLLRKTLAYHIYLFVAIRLRRRSRIQYGDSGSFTTYCGVKLRIDLCSSFMRNVILDHWYEKPELLLCDRYFTNTDRVLELGSAIGFLSLYCLIKLRVSQIALVEANPKTIAVLKENYALNGLTPKIIHCAVSSVSGTASFDVGGEFWANSLHTNQGEVSSHTITVPTKTLDDILGSIGFQPTALIIDIEGGETAINPREIPLSVETILIEMHPQVIGFESQYHLLAQYDAYGFYVADYREGTYCLKRRITRPDNHPELT